MPGQDYQFADNRCRIAMGKTKTVLFIRKAFQNYCLYFALDPNMPLHLEYKIMNP